MLHTNAIFSRKEGNFETRACVVEKVIRLSGERYDSFAHNMLRDEDFIRDNKLDSVQDSDGNLRCLLVVGEGRRDGMKQQRSGVRLIAVLPCETQANNWSVEQRERYFNSLPECDEVITLHTHYTRSCMFERNRKLVDSAAYLLAVYDGGAKGGTAYTVGYAKQKNRQTTIIHPDTLLVTSSTSIDALHQRGQIKIVKE